MHDTGVIFSYPLLYVALCIGEAEMLFLDLVAETYINMCSLKQDPAFSILWIELSNRASLVLKHQGSALRCRQGFL